MTQPASPPPLQIAVLGSGTGSNYRAIAKAIAAGRLPARVVAVVSDVPTAGILELAASHGAPAIRLPPSRFKHKLEPAQEQDLARTLRDLDVDLVVLAGFMRLLNEPLIGAFPRRIINIHPSLLPKYPGLEAWRQALAAGETETGCTVHYVDLGMDTGEIIAQETVPVLPGDTAATLHARIQEAEHALYPRVIADLARGWSRRPSKKS
jgi:phosphoribosylglycinamide formyltransferase-1